MRAHAASLLDLAPTDLTFRTARDAVNIFPYTLPWNVALRSVSLSLFRCAPQSCHISTTSVLLLSHSSRYFCYKNIICGSSPAWRT